MGATWGSFFDELRRANEARKIQTGRSDYIIPQQALQSALTARYEADSRAEQVAAENAFREKSYQLQAEQVEAQKNIAPYQTAISGIGALGTAALGARSLGLWGTTPTQAVAPAVGQTASGVGSYLSGAVGGAQTGFSSALTPTTGLYGAGGALAGQAVSKAVGINPAIGSTFGGAAGGYMATGDVYGSILGSVIGLAVNELFGDDGFFD